MMGVLLLLVLSVSFPSAALSADCTNRDVLQIVGQIEASGDYSDLERLLEDPSAAAACLVEELAVVPQRKLLAADRSRLKGQFHIVWCLRALRYITGGRELTADVEQLDGLEEPAKQFLGRRGEDHIPFFRVWMSRDTILLAPPESQQQIIEKWKAWVRHEARPSDFRRTESLDDWYF